MINQDYLFCEDWSNVEAQQLPEKAIYLYEQDAEDRSVYRQAIPDAYSLV